MEFQFSLENIRDAAQQFWKEASGKRVFAFHGQMGAGKTSFIHALCDEKGVTDAVTSPTFSIINEYRYSEEGVRKSIYHLDLYRLRSEQEAIHAGVEDCLYSENICLVEWPGKAPGIFPPDTLHLYLEIIDPDQRKLHTDDKIS